MDNLNSPAFRKDINTTLYFNLCISCGLCKAMCPRDAISITPDKGRYLPKIDYSKCIKCGICLKVCPGIDIDSNLLTTSDFLQLENNENITTSYLIAAKNSSDRFHSTSGGFISTLISTLLDSNAYSGAFVCNSDCGEDSQLKYTYTTEYTFKHTSAGSKYLPISAIEIAEYAQKCDTLNSIVVCTPCILLGLKKYLNEKNINYKDALFIGLFCDCTLNENFIKYLSKIFSHKNERIIKLEFRNKERSGWPGNVKVHFDNGRELTIPSNTRVMLKKYFRLFRCISCRDKFNSMSDISCGDCYQHNEKSFLGLSNIIIRTEKGRKAFELSKYNFVSKLTSHKKVVCSQNFNGVIKKYENAKHLKLLIESENRNQKSLNKNIRKQLRLITIGESGNFNLIRFYYNLEKLFLLHRKVFFKTRRIFSKLIQNIKLIQKLWILASKCKSIKTQSVIPQEKTNAIIFGGNFVNKGAQAMCFHLINELNKCNGFEKIFLFSSVDHSSETNNDVKYNFEVVNWDQETSDYFTGFKVCKNQNKIETLQNIESVFRSARAIFDISGFGLSSKHGVGGSIKYLANIYNAQRFDTPFYILPQSIGPFNFRTWYKPFTNYLLGKLLKYPKKLFAREQKSYDYAKQFRQDEVILSPDMVLFLPEIDFKNIYINAPSFKCPMIKDKTVCIVPNERVADRLPWNKLANYYTAVINTFLSGGYHIIILRHSIEDLITCEKIKSLFMQDCRVELLTDDFNKFELELIIRKCEFLVASRYHALIHAYRNTVPTLVLGWADKYQEIMNNFYQSEYHFSLYSNLDLSLVKKAIESLITKKSENKNLILKGLIQTKESGKHLEQLFSSFENYEISPQKQPIYLNN